MGKAWYLTCISLIAKWLTVFAYACHLKYSDRFRCISVLLWSVFIYNVLYCNYFPLVINI